MMNEKTEKVKRNGKIFILLFRRYKKFTIFCFSTLDIGAALYYNGQRKIPFCATIQEDLL